MKNFIVLLTDFNNDFYIGQMKGVIKNINPDAEIIDLCHNITPQNVLQASVILAKSYKYFPKKSIFVCIVDPTVGSDREILLVKTSCYIFLVPNNGLITEVINKEKKYSVYKVTNTKFFLPKVSNTFHGRDIFSPVSAYLSKGVSINKICEKFEKTKIVRLHSINTEVKKVGDKKVVVGKYLFSDSFGNIVTSLPEEMLNKDDIDKYRVTVCYRNKPMFEIKLKKCYTDVGKSKLVAYINSFGYIEIAINKGNADKFLSNKINLLTTEFLLWYE
jgi:S-adenosylmethionine hydrolase